MNDWKTKPDVEYRFFVYEDGDFYYFKDTEQRDSFANDRIQLYLDDGWNEDVEQIVCGELTHTCSKVRVKNRPPEEEIDENGEDLEGDYWEEYWDQKCDYEMVNIEDV